MVKQVPQFEAMELGPDGRLSREGLAHEMNPYCSRAVAIGTSLAADGGVCTVFTLGPPTAEDCLREAIAWGADHAVLITDPEFRGSDTYATAHALAAAVRMKGPFDIVLVGKNSVDADTGQVGPALAELLELPFLGAVRKLCVQSCGTVLTQCEDDDGHVVARSSLPVVVSCAERLCEPAKASRERRAAVDADRIQLVGASDLPLGRSTQSLTTVNRVDVLDVHRAGECRTGELDELAAAAADFIAEAIGMAAPLVSPTPEVRRIPSTQDSGRVVGVVVDPGRPGLAAELLGAAAMLSLQEPVRVTAVVSGPGVDYRTLSSLGADEIVEIRGAKVAEDVAAGLISWCAQRLPWAVLAPATMWGREVIARAATRLGSGLTGDAIDVRIECSRLVALKPAFGGRLVASVFAESEIQMVTVRPGVLPAATPRDPAVMVPTEIMDVMPRHRVTHLESKRDDDVARLMKSKVVVGVGQGVDQVDYPMMQPLLSLLDAELGATRKVTDRGWLPRSRQIGITGNSISPQLYVAIGTSGKFNHCVGFRSARYVLAINSAPNAAIFEHADFGVVGEWKELIPKIIKSLPSPSA
jgi:electron transfer flavoprotein alpha subunit